MRGEFKPALFGKIPRLQAGTSAMQDGVMAAKRIPIIYYVPPQELAAEQQRCLDMAFDIIFEITLAEQHRISGRLTGLADEAVAQ